MTDERFLDWDEREPVNRPQDDADNWLCYCLSEEAHKRMLARIYEEARERRQHEQV